MRWDAFTAIEQALILLSALTQVWIAIRVIMASTGAEQYVRLMAYSTGILLFLVCRATGVTFADMLLLAHAQRNVWATMAIGGAVPFLVGILLSEATLVALRLGAPVLVRAVLMLGAFTIAQMLYTNYIALASKATTLDKALIPNLCYAVAVGAWLTFRYRDRALVRDTTTREG